MTRMLSCAIALLLAVAVAASAQPHRPVQWHSLSGDPVIENRVKTLLAKMTLEEKIGQMTQYASPGQFTTGARVDPDMEQHIKRGEVGSILNAVTLPVLRRLQKEAVEQSRLGIPILFGLDVVHGYKTAFPIPLAQSSSWDLQLIEQAERVAATETAAAGINWTYAPMVDIARDPRWGRVVEGAGEDPYLGGLVAQARVRGFQGAKIGDLDAILSCVKHFGAYGAAEAGRDYNTTDLSRQSLFNVYLPPYKAALEAGAATFMTSFNDLNGIPATGNRWLMTDILRHKWGFRGMLVTDYTAIPEMVNHRVVRDDKEAAALALNAGVDMDMQGSCYLNWLKQNYDEGKVTLDQIDAATCRILELKFMLGLMDDPYRFMDDERERQNTRRPEFLQKALEMAHESMVLLKNDERQVLPLSKSGSYTLALIGPYAADKADVNGAWSAMSQQEKSPCEGIAAKLAGTGVRVLRAVGCGTQGTDRSGFEQALATARQADVVVLMMGEGPGMTGEAQSRTSIGLTGVQQELMAQIAQLGKPTALVAFNGRPLDLSAADASMNAILEAWFLGSRTGDAVADVLFGDVNPSGHLTISFPRTLGQVPIYYNHKNTGRPIDPREPFAPYVSNYQDSVPNTPLYPFGHGLSYTRFTIGNVALDRTRMSPDGSITVSCDITNDGDRAGAQVVQVYVRDCVSLPTRPVKELKAFERVTLAPGETRHLSFTLTGSDLAIYDDNYNPITPQGDFKLWVGQSSADDSHEMNFTIEEK